MSIKKHLKMPRIFVSQTAFFLFDNLVYSLTVTLLLFILNYPIVSNISINTVTFEKSMMPRES